MALTSIDLHLPVGLGRLAGGRGHQRADRGLRRRPSAGAPGANGMTLTFANPTSPTFLGQAGGSLGLLGHQRCGGRIWPTSNRGPTRRPTSSASPTADRCPGIPNWVATNTSIPTLQGATTHVVVTIVGTQLTVYRGWQAGAPDHRGRPPARGRPRVHRGHRWSDRQLRGPERWSVTQNTLTSASGWTLKGNADALGDRLRAHHVDDHLRGRFSRIPTAVPPRNDA